jgi:hypothetical protein
VASHILDIPTFPEYLDSFFSFRRRNTYKKMFVINYFTKNIILFHLTLTFISDILGPIMKLSESFMKFNLINLAFHQQGIFPINKNVGLQKYMRHMFSISKLYNKKQKA